MFSYEGGVAIAFCLWVFSSASMLVSINSRLERNLNRIGQRLSWVTLRPKPIEADESASVIRKILKFSLIVGMSAPFLLLSWVYVAFWVGSQGYRLIQDRGAPSAVREFRWKLRNMDLSFDQLVRELMKITDEDPNSFESYKSKVVAELTERGLRVN